MLVNAGSGWTLSWLKWRLGRGGIGGAVDDIGDTVTLSWTFSESLYLVADESIVTLWWNWLFENCSTWLFWFDDEILDTDVVDATSDDVDDAVDVNLDKFVVELGVEALDEAVELGGSGAGRNLKVVGLLMRESLDVDASDDEFSNISLISFIFRLFAHLTPFTGLLGVCWLLWIDFDGYNVVVGDVTVVAWRNWSIHARRLWQLSVTCWCTIWSGTFGNSCFISWNNCMMLMLLHEHVLLLWSVRRWSVDFGVWSMLSHRFASSSTGELKLSSGKFRLAIFSQLVCFSRFIFISAIILLFAAIFCPDLKIESFALFFA